MNKTRILQLLTNKPVHTVCLDPADSRALEQAARDLGLAFWAVDFSEVTDKAGCVDTLTNSLGVAGWFSSEWDAVHDGFIELMEPDQKGGVLCLQHVEPFADKDHPSWLILLDLLAEANEYWREQGLSFWCVVLSETPEALSVPAMASP